MHELDGKLRRCKITSLRMRGCLLTGVPELPGGPTGPGGPCSPLSPGNPWKKKPTRRSLIFSHTLNYNGNVVVIKACVCYTLKGGRAYIHLV